MRIIYALLLLVSGFWNTGCLIDASKLAGFSNPKAKVKYHPWSGFTAEVGTDFTGKLDGDYDPATGKATIHAEVTSGVSSVVTAEGERADHLVELRRIETTYYLEAQKQVERNMDAAGRMISMAAIGGGEAVAKMVNAVAPVLAGSAIDIGGIGRATLGVPIVGPPGPLTP